MKNNRKRGKKQTDTSTTGVFGYALAKLNSYSTFNKSAPTWFMPHMYQTVRYFDNYSTGSLGATTAINQIMNVNSIFDPDRTGTGHQPMGFDTMATIYNRYRVLKTRWKIVFSPSSLAYHLCVVPVNNLLNSAVTTSATFNAAVENPRSTYWNQGASGQSKIVSGEIDLNILSGSIPTEYLADDRFEANVGASPSEVMSLNIAVYNPNASAITIFFGVELNFEVDWHDPITQPQS